jgi:hypothetical protein
MRQSLRTAEKIGTRAACFLNGQWSLKDPDTLTSRPFQSQEQTRYYGHHLF